MVQTSLIENGRGVEGGARVIHPVRIGENHLRLARHGIGRCDTLRPSRVSAFPVRQKNDSCVVSTGMMLSPVLIGFIDRVDKTRGFWSVDSGVHGSVFFNLQKCAASESLPFRQRLRSVFD